jgi:non-ribosomal peptide synthetase-like protein
MVPALLEPVAALPTLPSGKVDRGRLPAPRPRAVPAKPAGPDPRTETERHLVGVWRELFAPQAVSVWDDFFLDLGGHSLLAARMVSQLRRLPAFAHLSVLDVYSHPTPEALAAHLEATRPAVGPTPAGPRRASARAHFWCGLAQFFALYAVAGFYSLQWLAPYLIYTVVRENGDDLGTAALGSLAGLLALYPVMLLLTIVAKWTLLGRVRPGRYPLWGGFYFRWWLVRSLLEAVPTGYLCGTPLLALYYRLLGARIGPNVYLGSDGFFSFDLLAIGADSSIGAEVSALGYTVEDGMLIVAPVEVGSRCFVGTRAVLQPGSSLGDGARLGDLSLLRGGCHVPAGQRWSGSPARPDAKPAESDGTLSPDRPGRARRAAFALLHALGVLALPVVFLAAIFPGMMVLHALGSADGSLGYLLGAPLVALSFVVLLCLEIAALKWLLLGRIRAGRCPLHSGFYLRKWFVDRLLELSLDVLGPLYATIYLVPWYRLLGAKVGRLAEVSTASFISPDLLSIDDEGFLADNVSLGAARVDAGTVTIAQVRVGKKSFIGNSALLPPGCVVGDNCLVGCNSVPPAGAEAGVPDDTSWLGSPSFFLPQRQQSTCFPEETLSRPTAKLWAVRGLIEAVRVLLPSTGFVVLTSLLFETILRLRQALPLWQVVLLFPVLYAGCGVAAALFTVLLKWLVIGRYRLGEQPLWSSFVWCTELMAAVRENFADLFLVRMLTGTPFVCWFFRLLGVTIGRRVFLETTDLLEYDLVTLGDDVALNANCTIQTHLFEDRVMKMSHIHVGDGCSVGGVSLVLYDTHMEPGSRLEDLSLLMKGEVLPAGTRWAGIPATRTGSA